MTMAFVAAAQAYMKPIPSDTVMATTTEKGAPSFTTTTSACTDVFFKFTRDLDSEKVTEMCKAAWAESPSDFLKLILHTRDCEEGKGEKALTYQALSWLHSAHLDMALQLIPYLVDHPADGTTVVDTDVSANDTQNETQKSKKRAAPGSDTLPHLGYWKDLLAIVLLIKKAKGWDRQTLKQSDLFKMVVELFAAQLRQDEALLAQGKSVSLCGKYAPTPKGHHDKRGGFVDAIAKALYPQEHAYRGKYTKLLHALRQAANVPEVLFTESRFDELDFERMPSLCLNRHQGAFKRRCPERWEAYKAALASGKADIKARALYPFEILRAYMPSGSSGELEPEDAVVEAQWKKKVEEVRATGALKTRRIMPIADVSGSMETDNCVPLLNSISLSLLIADASEGPMAGHVFTFDDEPSLVALKGASFRERAREVAKIPWGGSTNFAKTFETCLAFMRENAVKAEDAPEVFLCISDMQFDCAGGRESWGATNYQHVRGLYEAAGYPVPQIWFWNVRGNTPDFPAVADQPGVACVSGYSPTVLKLLMAAREPTPYLVMRAAIDAPRYAMVDAIVPAGSEDSWEEVVAEGTG